MINVNNFDPSLLHLNKTTADHDFTIYYINYVKNLIKMDNLCLVFNDLDVIFRKTGKDKYLILSSTEKNKTMLENYTDLFDGIGEKLNQ